MANIKPVYIKNPDLMNSIASNIVHKKPKRIGFDLEYTPKDRVREVGDGLVATIQVWVPGEQEVYVFHIARMGGSRRKINVPDRLKELLQNPTILKSGVNVRGDIGLLSKVGVEMPDSCVEDITSRSKSMGIVLKDFCSLAGLAQLFLRVGMRKDLARSYWDGDEDAPDCALNPNLLNYAALDAWVGGKIALLLDDVESSIPPTLDQGHHVVLFLPDMTSRIAYGTIIHVETPVFARVEITHLFRPSYKLLKEQKSLMPGSDFTSLRDMKSFCDSQGQPVRVPWKFSCMRHRILPSQIPDWNPSLPPLPPGLLDGILTSVSGGGQVGSSSKDTL
jgi:hypothetical protein